MDISPTGPALRIVKYNDIWVRVFFAAVAGLIISWHNKFSSFTELTAEPGIYKLFGATFVMAMVLTTALRWVCIKLDKKYAWETAPFQRIFMQVVFGFGLAFCAAFLMAYLGYLKKDVSIWETRWLFNYGLIDALMILLVNFYYICWYVVERFNLFNRTQAIVPKITDDPILFVTIDDRNRIIQRASGVEVQSGPGGLNVIYDSLPGLGYFLFKRNCIIRMDNIIYAEKIPEGGAYAFMKFPKGHKIFVSERESNKLGGFFRK